MWAGAAPYLTRSAPGRRWCCLFLGAGWQSGEKSRQTEERSMYIGPDTLMPVASALAAIGGILMIFWRRTVAFVRVSAQAVGRGVARAFGKR
jgi:hypothetical protein